MNLFRRNGIIDQNIRNIQNSKFIPKKMMRVIQWYSTNGKNTLFLKINWFLSNNSYEIGYLCNICIEERCRHDFLSDDNCEFVATYGYLFVYLHK